MLVTLLTAERYFVLEANKIDEHQSRRIFNFEIIWAYQSRISQLGEDPFSVDEGYTATELLWKLWLKMHRLTMEWIRMNY